jgi:two-component sensor histidine kinase
LSQNAVDIFDLKSLKLLVHVPAPLKKVACSEGYANEFYLFMPDTVISLREDGAVKKLPNGFSKDQYPSANFSARSDFGVLLFDAYSRVKTIYAFDGTKISARLNHEISGYIQNCCYVDNRFWLSTSSGIYTFLSDGRALKDGKPYFSGKSMTSVIKDREGNYWFGTTNEGLLFVPSLDAFQYRPDETVKKLVKTPEVLFMENGKGRINALEFKTNRSYLFYDENSNTPEYYMGYDSLTKCLLSSGRQFKIIDMQGKLKQKATIAVKDCRRLDSSVIAISASGLLGFFNFGSSRPSIWDLTKSTRKTIDNGFTYNETVVMVRGKSVAYRPDIQTVYYAASTGLYAVTPNRVSELTMSGKPVYASCLKQYGRHIFVLGTQGQLWEMINDTLPGKPILKGLEGGQEFKNIKITDHYLVLFGEQGIKYYDLKVPGSPYKEIILSHTEISDVETWNGKLFMATSHGIVIQNLEQKETVSRPIFVINSIKAGSKFLNLNVPLEINYHDNNIEINYSILAFRPAHAPDLYYSINNMSWEKISDDTRTLRLAALEPDRYTLRFRLGEQGVAGTLLAPIVLVIHPPWWQTKWAFTSFMLLFVVVFFGIYKWQTGILKRQNQLLLQKFDLERDLRISTLKSIKAQMNPHFFYNALNTIQSFIFTDDKRNAATYLSKFSKLTRTILEMSEKETVSLTEEIDALTLYLEIEQVRFENDFTFSITKQENLNTDVARIPSMIIQPYVENAIKHGLLHKKGQKELKIDFSISNAVLMVKVSDNGIGRLRSGELNRIRNTRHESFATQANSKRLNILNRGREKVGVEYIDKKDELGNSLGTEVVLRIPLG